MKGLFEKIEEAKKAVEARIKTRPQVAIVLGTGLGGMGQSIEAEATIPYDDIPHFVKATGLGHDGNLVVGKLGGKNVVAMQGRLHYYEGYSMKEITFPLRVMHALGAGELVMSSAVGGMNPHLDRGDIVALTDFINLMGDNPLIGWNDDRLGPRFPDMSEPFDGERRRIFEKIALEKGVTVRRAVLVAVAGPNLETAAEYRFLRRIGADVVGMSTVPETIVAAHSGMKVLALSIVTDLCPADNLQPADIKEIIETAEGTEPKLRELVVEYLQRL
ncbi:MAG: purine-nucleoside phosphorylase [Candidatus Latescibacterota bacterium]|nr:MAG: purine-nucleoside phosphorylase [Candidatus Latescibacterota bacterium]